MMARGPLASVFVYGAVAVLVVSILAPVFWLFIMSISGTKELTELPLHWIPQEPDFSRYVRLFTLEEGSSGREFLYALRNSLSVALMATAVALIAGVPAAYSFSRFPGRMASALRCSRHLHDAAGCADTSALHGVQLAWPAQ